MAVLGTALQRRGDPLGATRLENVLFEIERVAGLGHLCRPFAVGLLPRHRFSSAYRRELPPRRYVPAEMATRDQTRPRERSLHAAAEGSTIATTTQSSRQSCLPLSRSPPNPLQRHHGERCLVINIIVAINKTVTSLIRAISACAAIAGASNLAERNIYQSVDVL